MTTIRNGLTRGALCIATALLMVSMTASNLSGAHSTLESEAWSATIFAVGDIGLDQLPKNNPNRYQYDKVADLVTRNNPDAFFVLGDAQHNEGKLEDYMTRYDVFFHDLGAITYPVTGNHDYYVSDYADGYFDYFGNESNCANYDLVTQYENSDGNPLGYYSFDIGPWHIIALNDYLGHQVDELNWTDEGIPKEGFAARQQYDWLLEDLAAHSGDEYTGTIAMMHHPLYDWELYYRCEWISWFDLAPQVHLWEAMYEYGVDLVLSGHNHNYQRWAPMNPWGESADDGVQQIVAGTGGAYLWHFPQETPLDCTGDYPYGLSVDTISNLEYWHDDDFGALQLTLTETGCDYIFVTVDDEVIDSGSVACA